MDTISRAEYSKFYGAIKRHIQSAQIKAAVSVNRELLRLYWNIGKEIVDRQKTKGWGDSVVERLAYDLRKEFPGLKGFSRANMFSMRQWYLFYSKGDEKVQQLVGQLPWGHNLVILGKVKDLNEAVFYSSVTLEHGWSRNVLAHQIEIDLYHRKGRALTNFKSTLPVPQSDFAHELLKDPYHFDFLTIDDKARENELESNLIKHLQDFLLELGVGFAFVGSQKHCEVAGEDFYIDLLFYHIKLHAYVVIDLKTGEFKPEYAGKMGFYLSAIDDAFKGTDDNPSIGLILCRTKNKLIVEYALRGSEKPIGVSEYKLTRRLPKEFKDSLPTIAQIEAEVSQIKEKRKPPTPPGLGR